jgi:hypothetical protein
LAGLALDADGVVERLVAGLDVLAVLQSLGDRDGP